MKTKRTIAYFFGISIAIFLVSSISFYTVKTQILPNYAYEYTLGLDNLMYLDKHIESTMTVQEMTDCVDTLMLKYGIKKLDVRPADAYEKVTLNEKNDIILYGATHRLYVEYFKKLIAGDTKASSVIFENNAVLLSKKYMSNYAIGDEIVLKGKDREIKGVIAAFIYDDTFMPGYNTCNMTDYFAGFNGLAVMPFANAFNQSDTYNYYLSFYDINSYAKKFSDYKDADIFVAELEKDFLNYEKITSITYNDTSSAIKSFGYINLHNYFDEFLAMLVFASVFVSLAIFILDNGEKLKHLILRYSIFIMSAPIISVPIYFLLKGTSLFGLPFMTIFKPALIISGAFAALFCLTIIIRLIKRNMGLDNVSRRLQK